VWDYLMPIWFRTVPPFWRGYAIGYVQERELDKRLRLYIA